MEVEDILLYSYITLKPNILSSGVQLNNYQIQFLQDPSSVPINEIYHYIYNSPNEDFRNFVACFLFQNYIMNPEASSLKDFKQVISILVNGFPERKDSINSHISSFLLQLLNTSQFQDQSFTAILDLLSYCIEIGLDLAPIKLYLRVKVSTFLISLWREAYANKNIFIQREDCTKIIQSLSLGIDLFSETNQFINSLLDLIIDLYDLDRFKRNQGEPFNHNLAEAVQPISYIKLFDLTDQNASKIKRIEDALGSFIQVENLAFHNEDTQGSWSSIDLGKVSWRQEREYRRAINDFEVEIFIGVLSNKELVAKKVYKLSDSSKAKYLSSISKEIETLIAISERAEPQNSFVKFYGSVMSGNVIELYMEAHEMTLSKLIESRQGQRFSDDQIKKFISSLLDFFSELQSKNIFHRDIKPSNILVTKEMVPKVIDFGTADKIEQSDQTMLHDIQGTKAYMAPELLKAVDDLTETKYRPERTDVYSLGVTFFEIAKLMSVTSLPGGRKAFENNYLSHVNALPVSDDIKNVIRPMLRPDYAERPDFRTCIGLLADDKTIFN